MTTSHLSRTPSTPRVLDLLCPSSTADLLSLVGEGRRVIAGGTDLLVRLAQIPEPAPPLVVSVAGVRELGRIDVEEGQVRIGAGVTHAQVAENDDLRRLVPALTDASEMVGSIQIRMTATVAGNVCNASPSADTVPALAVHGSIVEVAASGGARRSVPIAEFSTGPGGTVLTRGEAVVGLTVDPLGPREGSAYRRFTVRNSMDLAFAGVAVRIAVGPDRVAVRSAKIALGAVGPTVVVADKAAEILRGWEGDTDQLMASGRVAAEESLPISDLRASADFRLQLVRVLVADCVREAVRRARSQHLRP